MQRVISLGAGVQSTAMLLMALHGEFGDMPDCAVFADTGWEPKAVYEHLAALIEHVSPFCYFPLAACTLRGAEMVTPIHIVSAGNIRDDVLRSVEDGSRFVPMPVYAKYPSGAVAPLRRQCTNEYKISPIMRHERRMLGLMPHQLSDGVMLEQWIGVSLDEAHRMKPSQEKWKTHRFPLVEKRLTRQDCISWLRKHDYPVPPKSSCIGCPFHNDNFWYEMRRGDPASWQEAVMFDQAIRRLPRIEGENYLHRSGIALDQVKLGVRDHGQQEFSFDGECEGMCGV